MNLYTEMQVLKIIKYACVYQKGASYQEIEKLVLRDGRAPSDTEKKILDNLADPNNNAHLDLTIDDIEEFLEEDANK